MTRRSILFGNELGRGYGHLHKLLVVARGARALGNPVLFVPSPDAAPALELGARPIPILPAPDDERPTARLELHAMGDILAAAGMADAAYTSQRVRQWDAILAEVNPALVVTDYAPFLSLAAHGRVARIALGTGFTLPPEHLPGFPEFFANEVRREPSVEATIAAVLVARGLGSVSAPSLLGGEHSFVCVVPELDVYAGWRRIPAVGPLTPGSPMPPFADSTFFAYLDGQAESCAELLAGLVRSGRPGRVFVRNVPGRLMDSTVGSQVAWCVEPLPPSQVMAEHSLIVHHGGANTAQQALLAGRPQLVLPDYVEQVLNGHELQRMGVGKLLSRREQSAERVAYEVTRMTDPTQGASGWRAVAQEKGRWLHRQYSHGCVDSVINAAAGLLGR